MTTMLILRGLPASGKTTYARSLVHKGWKRVSKDDIRMMLDNGLHTSENESIVHHVQRSILNTLMVGGHLIVVDNTHGKDRVVEELEALALGRFPANLVLSHSEGCDAECVPDCAVKALDEQSGVTTSGVSRRPHEAYDGVSLTGFLRGHSSGSNQHGGTGGASRFFYCAKASKSDRNRKAKDGKQAPDRKEHVTDELFDPAGNPARGHSA